MSKLIDKNRKYFLPGWVLAHDDLSAGDKIILAILWTRSSDVEGGGRISLMTYTEIARLARLHERSVIRGVASMAKLSLVTKVPKGFLVAEPPVELAPGEEDLSMDKALDGFTSADEVVRALTNNTLPGINKHMLDQTGVTGKMPEGDILKLMSVIKQVVKAKNLTLASRDLITLQDIRQYGRAA